MAQGYSDMVGARRILELNLEMNPDHADSYALLAQLDLAHGDKDAAKKLCSGAPRGWIDKRRTGNTA